MLNVAIAYFLVSVVVFVGLLVLTSRERSVDRRIFLPGIRDSLDRVLTTMVRKLSITIDHFVRYILQLHWYYSIHSILKTILRVIVVTYTRVDAVFEKNRQRTKQLRKERRQRNEMNHLTQMSVHKTETALSPVQKRKLRDKQLAGKD